MADLAVNRRARFDYEILETYEAGLALLGSEVKAARSGRANLMGSFVVIRGGEAWLVNAAIAPYQPKNAPAGYNPARSRKLLLRREELRRLIGASAAGGLTFVPLRLYNKGSRIKLEFGLGRRKKKHDKRERLREREDRRTIARSLRIQ